MPRHATQSRSVARADSALSSECVRWKIYNRHFRKGTRTPKGHPPTTRPAPAKAQRRRQQGGTRWLKRMRSTALICLTPEAKLAARPSAKLSLAAPPVVLGVAEAVRDWDWADSPCSASCAYRCSLRPVRCQKTWSSSVAMLSGGASSLGVVAHAADALVVPAFKPTVA